MCTGVVVAVVQALSRATWVVVGVLAGVAALASICPWIDAALGAALARVDRLVRDLEADAARYGGTP